MVIYGLVSKHFYLELGWVGKLRGQVLTVIVVRMLASFPSVALLLDQTELTARFGGPVGVCLSDHPLGWPTAVDCPRAFRDRIDMFLL